MICAARALDWKGVVRMPRLEIFDGPMCCPTGVCGPSVDPKLSRFAVDLG